MIIIHENDAPSMDVPAPDERTLRLLLSPAKDVGVDPIAVGQTILPPAGQSDCIGHQEGELLYSLSGAGEILVEGERRAFLPGTAVWVPPMEVHQLLNPGKEEMKVLWVLCPAGRERAILDHKQAIHSEEK